MSWLILTILGICARAVYGVLTKVFSNHIKASAITQSVILLTLGAILSSVISPLIGGISFRGLSGLWLVAIIMIASTALGNITYFIGMTTLEASASQMAFASILIWGAVLSIAFLGSHFSFIQLTGMAVLLLAIWLTQVNRGVRLVSTGTAWIILSAAFFAVFQVTSAELAKTLSAGGYLVLAYFGAAIIIALIYFKRVSAELRLVRQKLKVSAQVSLATIAASLLYYLFTYFAYQSAPNRGVVVVLLTAQVVLAVILSIIFLKERKHVGRKLAGGVMALAAGIMIRN